MKLNDFMKRHSRFRGWKMPTHSPFSTNTEPVLCQFTFLSLSHSWLFDCKWIDLEPKKQNKNGIAGFPWLRMCVSYFQCWETTASICLHLINVSVANLKEPCHKWKRVMFHSGVITNPTAFVEKNCATLSVIGRETQLKVSLDYQLKAN